jgi:tripartite-type tricarboxylate transporter receptor subunit TctC
MKTFLLVLQTLWICIAHLPANAQDFPNRPVHLIVPFAPGAGSDTVARLVAQRVSETAPYSFVVENKSGAGGMLASRFVATSPPDGYTLLLVTGAYPTQAAMMKQMPFDPVRDITSISSIIEYPFVLIVRADAPYQTIQDLISTAKSRPGQLNYATTGAGSVHHLATELFNSMAQVKTIPIAYRGGTTQILELLAGRVDFVFETLPSASAAIADGRARALAVTSAQRWPAYPQLPAVSEFLPQYDVVSFLGLAAPGGTPAPIIAKLNADVVKALNHPEVRERFHKLGGELRLRSPADMNAFVAGEISKWKNVVAKSGIELQ